MRTWLREPLLHFLLLGAVLFGLSAWLGERGEDAVPPGGEIVVTQGRIHSLVETFTRQWSRPPTEDDIAGLIRDFVREEALVREALALGLDRDDTVVRRRLAQKMEFLAGNLAEALRPTDEDLRAYLAAHPDAFREDARFTFRQVFLDRLRRGESLGSDAAKMLARLEAAGSAPGLEVAGDSVMLDPHYEDVSRREVEALFGAEFAARLEDLPAGRWLGPIESGYGAHLVRVEGRTPGRLPALEEVRDAVSREWSAAKAREIKEAQFQALLSKYAVTIEQPRPEAARGAAAGGPSSGAKRGGALSRAAR